jgi:hypothetical protein
MAVHRLRPRFNVSVDPYTKKMLDDLTTFERSRSRLIDEAVKEYYDRRRKR